MENITEKIYKVFRANIYKGFLFMEVSNIFELAREKYKPEKIKFLLIAEAPPSVESGCFFYFEDVRKGDSLFLETMKALYPDKYTNTPDVRARKKEFLQRFKNDGFYLIDSLDHPIERSNKIEQIKNGLQQLIEKIERLVDKDTPIILICSTVYKACNDKLRAEGFNVINLEPIPFAGNGHQNEFRQRLQKLLGRYNRV